MWMYYIDHAAELVDSAPDPEVGAIGSCWQLAESEEHAQRVLQEYLAKGYTRGHNWAPRF